MPAGRTLGLGQHVGSGKVAQGQKNAWKGMGVACASPGPGAGLAAHLPRLPAARPPPSGLRVGHRTRSSLMQAGGQFLSPSSALFHLP